MNNLVGCRDIESFCRQRAALDHEHSWKWLGEAERWGDLADREINSRFEQTPMHPGPMAMGPNTIDGDLHK
jgi:hypothetical protein